MISLKKLADSVGPAVAKVARAVTKREPAPPSADPWTRDMRKQRDGSLRGEAGQGWVPRRKGWLKR